jgi:hypothetical protein
VRHVQEPRRHHGGFRQLPALPDRLPQRVSQQRPRCSNTEASFCNMSSPQEKFEPRGKLSPQAWTWPLCRWECSAMGKWHSLIVHHLAARSEHTTLQKNLGANRGSLSLRS